ncbi:MAG: serine/threonine protein kinase [Deltaproteobacteria bacterium]|nr:serine/threonine protein kinase [Deltaproteobacteria bacterium]
MSGIPAGAGSLLGKRLGKFEILALLALGGTAEIYLARIDGAAGFEKYVVVKCLHDHLADDPEFVKMFLDEARLAAHLDHSNIVQTMELGEQNNRYFMVMEFLAGLSLAMVVRRVGERCPDGRMPIPLALNILAQACAGLHYAHEKAMNGKALNIVHRDISPQNLVVSFEGVVKVVDFGIAKAEFRETRTRSGTIKGKFAYMSPEQCVANNVDRRTDVFALGVIGHELLTGRRLFKKPSPYETYQAVIECNVDPPSRSNIEVDPALDPIIMRAICKDREHRYQTAEAFGDALLGYLHHRGKGSGPGDVARFFDATFDEEIEEHGQRMRELISGRDASVDLGAAWDAEEEARREESKRHQTVDPSQDDASRSSASTLSVALEGLGDGKAEDAEDMPADRTRIETNPLERLNELDNAVASQPARKIANKFPDPATLATMVGEADASDHANAVRSLPELARTELGMRPIEPRLGDALARTTTHPQAFHAAPRPSANPQPRLAPPEESSMRPSLSQVPTGYPVMNAQLSEQIATGATVFPTTGSYKNAPTLDPQRAAELASPVGHHYPAQVDWAAAAARPARPMPPWMLVLLFLGAIGVALAITMVIARIIR